MRDYDMEQLRQLIVNNEDWLMHRVLWYAKEQNYVKYTSTLAEAWRISIANLSATILTAIDTRQSGLELGPDENFTEDPIARFGIEEAQKHRARGLTLGMFLSLFKYYRQSYVDLILTANLDAATHHLYHYFIDRCFDRIELGLCTEWSISTNNDRLHELQTSNRFLTNEKNKYLTIFESLHDPVILLDNQNQVTNMNHAAARLFIGSAVPGDIYYDQHPTAQPLPWLATELAEFSTSQAAALNLEKTFNTTNGLRYFDVKLERMLDISEKFSGVVIVLNDMTEAKRAAILEERERLARELHDSVTQSLYSLSLFAEWGGGVLEAGEVGLAQERMVRIGEISQQALREMRLLLYELQLAPHQEVDLVEALQARMDTVERRAGVRAQLVVVDGACWPKAWNDELYPMAIETLNNALKHARASQVEVRLQGCAAGFEMHISDDGRGFEPHQTHGGMGLPNLTERARRLGGQVVVESTIGQGTRVSLIIKPGPVSPAPNPNPER
jgi:signal transduction histidine kinase